MTRGLVSFVFLWIVAVVMAVGQVLVLGSDVSFLSANHYENQNIKLNKNRSTPTFCGQSPWCVAGILAVINNNSLLSEVVYIELV